MAVFCHSCCAFGPATSRERASERSGHDQAAAKQIDSPDKTQMETDFLELRVFITTHKKKARLGEERSKELAPPPKAAVA